MSPASSPVKISQLRQIRRNTFALCGVAAGRASRKSHDANLLAQRAKQRSPESGLRSPPLNLSELIDADMSVLEKVRQLVSEKMDARRHTSQLLHHLAILGRRRAGVPRPPPPGRPPPPRRERGANLRWVRRQGRPAPGRARTPPHPAAGPPSQGRRAQQGAAVGMTAALVSGAGCVSCTRSSPWPAPGHLHTAPPVAVRPGALHVLAQNPSP